MPPRRKATATADKNTPTTTTTTKKSTSKSPKTAVVPKSPKGSPQKAATTPKKSTEKKPRTRKAIDKKNFSSSLSSNFVMVWIKGFFSKIESLWKGYFGHLPFVELVSLLWFFLDALTHLVMEGTYVYAALFSKWNSLGHKIWEKYSEADKRWYNVTDPTILSLEILTVIPVGLMCAWTVYCIYKKLYLRHLLIVIISTAELYGGWMTFCPEWIDGNKNLIGDTPIKFWIYLVFMNGVWVIIPLVLLYLSSKVLLSKKTAIKLSTVDSFMVQSVLAVIVLYAILVPVILIFDLK